MAPCVDYKNGIDLGNVDLSVANLGADATPIQALTLIIAFVLALEAIAKHYQRANA